MKKMYTISSRLNPQTGKQEQFYTFCKKAQKFMMSLLAKRIAETGKAESRLVQEFKVSTSMIHQLKKADNDRGALISGIERFALMVGKADALELINEIDMETRGSVSDTGTALTTVGEDAEVAVPAIRPNGRVYSIGQGVVVLQNGKTRIVLHELDVEVSKGRRGETIVAIAS